MFLFANCIALFSCSEKSEERVAPAQSRYDLLIRNGTLYDRSGGEPFVGATPGRFVRGPGWGEGVDLIAE